MGAAVGTRTLASELGDQNLIGDQRLDPHRYARAVRLPHDAGGRDLPAASGDATSKSAHLAPFRGELSARAGIVVRLRLARRIRRRCGEIRRRIAQRQARRDQDGGKDDAEPGEDQRQVALGSQHQQGRQHLARRSAPRPKPMTTIPGASPWRSGNHLATVATKSHSRARPRAATITPADDRTACSASRCRAGRRSDSRPEHRAAGQRQLAQGRARSRAAPAHAAEVPSEALARR